MPDPATELKNLFSSQAFSKRKNNKKHKTMTN